MLMLAAVLAAGSATAQYSKELEKKAKGGDVEAMLAVGDAYAKGDGVAKDAKKAEEWYKKAEKEKCDDAYIHHANLYTSWDGIEKNPEKYKKLLDNGVKKKMPKTALERARLYQQQLQENVAAGNTKDETASTKKWMKGRCSADVAEQIAAMYPEMCANYKFYTKYLEPLYKIAADAGNAEGIEKYAPIYMARGVISIPKSYITAYEKANGSKTPAMEKLLEMMDTMRKYKGENISQGDIDELFYRIERAPYYERDKLSKDASYERKQAAERFSKENQQASFETRCRIIEIENSAELDNLAAIWAHAIALYKEGKATEARKWAKRIPEAGGYAPFPATMSLILYKIAGDNNELMLYFDDMINDDPMNVYNLITQYVLKFNQAEGKIFTYSWSTHPTMNSGIWMKRITNLNLHNPFLSKDECMALVADAKARATGEAREKLTELESRLRR